MCLRTCIFDKVRNMWKISEKTALPAVHLQPLARFLWMVSS